MLWAAVDSTVSAWCGPSLFVASRRGECGDRARMTGYYFRETRHLSTLRLRLNGQAPWWCGGGAVDRDRLSLIFVFPEVVDRPGPAAGGSGAGRDEVQRDQQGLPRRALELGIDVTVGPASLAIGATMVNRAREPVSLDLRWILGADFTDLLEAGRDAGIEVRPVADGARLEFRLADPELPLATVVEARGPLGWRASAEGLSASVTAAPGQPIEFGLDVVPSDPADPLDREAAGERECAVEQWRGRLARARGPGGEGPFAGLVNRSIDDLGSLSLLEGSPDEWLAPAAGVPMYPALFGRDALTAAWQAASLDRGEMLDAALTRLGRIQGHTVDPARDEQPGRIVQQVRRGRLARLGRTPFGRYYGDMASPLMYVVALAHLYAWDGRRRTLGRHWDTARRVLDWARERGDADGDGYLEYRTRAAEGPTHQGWKDSGDAVIREDGGRVEPPIAAAEVQGYWFAALQLATVMAAVSGARHDAVDYWRAARDLKRRFNRDFWMPEQRYVALALDADKRPVRSVASNAGHCLAAGILSAEHVRAVAGRLFAPDLFSGWGIRTLSSDHPSYDPVSYHRGSVWAVENATIAFGLRRYGLNARALDLAGALVELAALYPSGRIPECVGGYPRWEHPHPGAYPRATSPQAWNQSAFPLLLQTLLGLQPLAPLRTLLVDPVLPSWLPEVTLERLRVGDAVVALRFRRGRRGRTRVRILARRGALRVLRQPPPESLTARVPDRLRGLLMLTRWR